MSEQQLDAQGEAHEALKSAVAGFGPRVLSDPRLLGNLVTDLLPDLPRERALLVTGAEADVAGELTQRVEEQHVNPETAVQLVAHTLTGRRAIDPAASMWVATEYAQALGYSVRSDAQPSPSEFGTVPPEAISAALPTVTALPNQAAPPPDRGRSGAPAGGYSGYPGVQAPAGGQPPAPGWPTATGTGPPSPPQRRNRWPVFAAGGAAALVVVFVVAAFAGGLFNSSKATPKPTPIPNPASHPASHPASPIPRPTVAALTELLPQDIDDPASQCQKHTPPFTPVGLVQGGALLCNDPGLSGGAVEAYQMNSYASYQKSWANFNSWWGFSSGTPGSGCPPPGGNVQAEGTSTWYDKFFPTRQGQVIECEWTGSGNTLNTPAYAWTYPTDNAFIVAWGATGSTFSALNTWWENNGEPLSSPTPATP